MTGTTRLAPPPMSFRGRFLLVVVLAAVVPLVLIGVWLTRSVVHAGQDLLRSELDKSLQLVAHGVESRWSYRRGELALLANNLAARRLLAAPPSTAPDSEDAQYLDQLVASLARTIPLFEYHDARGVVRVGRGLLADAGQIGQAVQARPGTPSRAHRQA